MRLRKQLFHDELVIDILSGLYSFLVCLQDLELFYLEFKKHKKLITVACHPVKCLAGQIKEDGGGTQTDRDR